MFNDVNQALEVLMARRRSLHPQLFQFKKCIEDLGNPQDELVTLHVAGTNGKGSTTNFLRSICQEQGYKVGTFTSPHLIHHHDRFRINDQDISDEKLLELINRSYPLWDKYDLTMFEIDTLIAIWYFIDEEVDVAIFEVGMGGRKDSTNVVKPLASIITNISMDHMKQLGDTLEKIAGEKAGIIKETGLVITADDRPNIQQIFKDKAQREIYTLEPIKEIDTRIFEYRNEIVKIQSFARYQEKNAALAFEVCYQLNKHNLLKFSVKSILRGLYMTEWKGRFQRIDSDPLTIIDGAHNQDGIRNLVESFDQLPQPVVVVFAALKDKETDKMVNQLYENCKYLILTEFDFYRAQKAELLKTQPDQIVIDNFKVAINKGKELVNHKGSLVITGSLYFISEVYKYYGLDK